MGTPLYNTDIIPMTSRPTLTVMDDGDYFVILDTSTGKISKILRTNIQKALNISYDNTTSELTAETVQAALDELVVNLGSSDSAILALAGRLDTLEGTGAGSVAKAIDDAVSPLAEVVDTNRLYSDSQYLSLKAQADAQALEIQASRAELYNGYPILQFGSTDIIGKGTKADYSAIDVSANVVDGSLEMEQKGLTIRNLVSNGNVATSLTSDNSGTPIFTLANGTWAFNGSGAYSVSYQTYNGNIGDKILFRFKIKDSSVGRIGRRITIIYSNGTTQNDGQISDNVIETHSIITLNSALPFNVYIGEGSIGLIERDYQLAYNLTALGLDHITDTDILSKLLPYVDETQNVGKMGVLVRGVNLFDKSKATKNFYIDVSSGSLIATKGRAYSGYIEVSHGMQFYLTNSWDIGIRVEFYNKAKTRIGGLSVATTAPFTIGQAVSYGTSANASYIRFNFVLDNIDTCQLNLGSTALPYEPYQEQLTFLPAIGNSLPNGTADSIKTVADGWEHTKRVSDSFVLDGTEGWSSFSVSESTDYCRMYFVSFSAQFPNMALLNTSLGYVYGYNDVHTFGSGNHGAIGTPYVIGNNGATVFLITLQKTYLDTNYTLDLAGFIAYLVDHPVTFHYQLATPVITHYDLPLPTSGKTIHRFAGEEKIALYGTGLTFSENVLSVLSAIKFVSGEMTDITDLATITDDIVTFSGVNATDVVYVKVEHDVDRPLGILEHTPAVSNTASRLAALEAVVFGG